MQTFSMWLIDIGKLDACLLGELEREYVRDYMAMRDELHYCLPEWLFDRDGSYIVPVTGFHLFLGYLFEEEWDRWLVLVRITQ